MRIFPPTILRQGLRAFPPAATQTSVPLPGGLGTELIPTAITGSTDFSGWTTSPYTGLSGGGAGMRDGLILANSSIAATDTGVDQWIKADLGSVKAVGKVLLLPIAAAHEDGWGPSYVDNRILEYSSDNITFTPAVNPITGTSESAYNALTLGLSTRYIRVRAPNDYVGLGDFRIFGP